MTNARNTPSHASARLLTALALLLPAACLESDAPTGDASFRSNDNDLTFEDIAQNPDCGLDYSRGASVTDAIFQAQKDASIAEPPVFYTQQDFVITPEKSRGGPGVALLDYDRDGDLDIYATNGPGRTNSLYDNQGDGTFVDVGASSGAGASAQDSTGVCFGDIDNDGDEDLYVLGRVEPNRMFENQGDGTFIDITDSSMTGAGALGHTSCSFGDVDNDGLIDVVVGNSFDWTNRFAIFAVSFAQNHPNQLFMNQGGNVFSDESDSSGIRELRGFTDGSEDRPTITWGIGMADIDGDGDIDIVQADDQAAMVSSKYIDPNTQQPGIDRGYMHVLINDGTGHFTDTTVEAGTNHPGQWMGVTFGDYNCDGNLDFFGANMGAYAFSVLPIPYAIEDTNSRWYLNQGDGTFADPGLGDLVADPFGWSPSSFDYDNDGDTDIVYFGSLDGAGPVITADNPGALLRNDGCNGSFNADFTADLNALSGVDHRARNVNGSAVGDLDGDGFTDIVSVSASDYFEAPLIPYPVAFGSAFDALAAFMPIFTQVNPGEFQWNQFEQTDGSLSVQLSSGDNGNHSATVRMLGTVGITQNGTVNRDGIGAIVTFTPKNGSPAMHPIVGGSNYSSQDSIEQVFGMGEEHKGTLEVFWPGGAHNQLRKVKAGERILFPEIPCDYQGDWDSFDDYKSCVKDSLHDLRDAGILTKKEAKRFKKSAKKAYKDFHDGDDD